MRKWSQRRPCSQVAGHVRTQSQETHSPESQRPGRSSPEKRGWCCSQAGVGSLSLPWASCARLWTQPLSASPDAAFRGGIVAGSFHPEPPTSLHVAFTGPGSMCRRSVHAQSTVAVLVSNSLCGGCLGTFTKCFLGYDGRWCSPTFAPGPGPFGLRVTPSPRSSAKSLFLFDLRGVVGVYVRLEVKWA